MPTFYRAALTDPATAIDFTSNKAKGKARRVDVESEEEWAGISVYGTERLCQKKAGDYGLGAYVVEITIPEYGDIRYDRVSPKHCNVWGEPEAFLSYVTKIVPV